LWLQYVDDHGEQRDVVLGTLRNVPRAELTAEVGDCARRCLVEQLYLAADGHAVADAQGELTVLRAEVDGRAAHWGFDEGRWRPARPFPVSLIDPPVRLSPRDTGGLTVDVFLRRLPPGNGPQPAMVAGFARITPDSTPDVLPVVITRDADLPPVPRHGTGLALEYPPGVVVATALNGQQVPARVAGRTAALPVLGRDGSMADLETSLVEFEPPPGAVTVVELWTAPGTPEPLLQAVRDAGITLTPLATLDSTLEGLRTDAFSVGLRLFLIVGVATLLLAVFGVLASAVLQSRWRSYEVASLRVVGVSQRSLVRASVGEHGAMLGFAVLLGLASAWLSLRLVLPSISLGPADEHDPVPAYAVHWPILAVVGAVLFLVAAGIALLVSVRTTRMGRPANLRWAEQG
jgi:hypothetical protein